MTDRIVWRSKSRIVWHTPEPKEQPWCYFWATPGGVIDGLRFAGQAPETPFFPKQPAWLYWDFQGPFSDLQEAMRVSLELLDAMDMISVKEWVIFGPNSGC